MLCAQAIQYGSDPNEEEPGPAGEALHFILLPAAPVCGHGAAQDG